MRSPLSFLLLVLLLLVYPALVAFVPCTDPWCLEPLELPPPEEIPWGHPGMINPPKIYDEHGEYRGEYSPNPYALDSISNPFGRYGSPYSSESLNNPYGFAAPSLGPSLPQPPASPSFPLWGY